MKKLFVTLFALATISFLGCSESSSNAGDALAEEDGKDVVEKNSSKSSESSSKSSESLDSCNNERQDLVSALKNVYYICDNLKWRKATHDEKLKGTIGECTPDILGLRVEVSPVDSNYTCSLAQGYSYDEYVWTISPKDSVLADCLAQNDTICHYLDTTFVYSEDYVHVESGWIRAPVWHYAQPEDVFGKCTPEIMDSLGTMDGKTYICRKNYWDEASAADIAAGTCDESKHFDTLALKEHTIETYVCVQNVWNRATGVDRIAGFCRNDGMKTRIREYDFVCDAEKRLWIHEFKDERDGRSYKSVMVNNTLVMAENLKYGGDSLYTWSKAMALDAACDTTSCDKKIGDTTNYQGICPDGWNVLNMSETLEFLDVYKSRASKEYSVIVSTTGWPKNIGTNETGLEFVPFEVDTTFYSVCPEYRECLKEDEKNGSPLHLVNFYGGEVVQNAEQYCRDQTKSACSSPVPSSFTHVSGTWVLGEKNEGKAAFFSIVQDENVDGSEARIFDQKFDVARLKLKKAPVRCKKKI